MKDAAALDSVPLQLVRQFVRINAKQEPHGWHPARAQPALDQLGRGGTQVGNAVKLLLKDLPNNHALAARTPQLRA